jgi:hypothetical protein
MLYTQKLTKASPTQLSQKFCNKIAKSLLTESNAPHIGPLTEAAQTSVSATLVANMTGHSILR